MFHFSPGVRSALQSIFGPQVTIDQSSDWQIVVEKLYELHFKKFWFRCERCGAIMLFREATDHVPGDGKAIKCERVA